MAKNSDTSWKKDSPNTFLSNSVEKANRAVKQAMSHPEKAFLNAEQHGEQTNAIQQNKEQLDLMKQQLNEVHGIVEEQ